MYIIVVFPKNFSANASKISFPLGAPSYIYRDKADAELAATKLAKENQKCEYVVFAAAKGFMQDDIPVVTKTYVMGY